MINLQMERYSVALGTGRWTNHIKLELRQERCTCCDAELCLSDDEILTDFVALDPQEASGDEWLLEQVAYASTTLEHGQQLALIRWKDRIESLVVFPAGDIVPSAAVLIAAYCNGCLTEYVTGCLDEGWDKP